MGGTGDQERAISAKAREALVRIGRESPINRRRVRKFGVQIDDEAPAWRCRTLSRRRESRSRGLDQREGALARSDRAPTDSKRGHGNFSGARSGPGAPKAPRAGLNQRPSG